jgi:hypothetical protein
MARIRWDKDRARRRRLANLPPEVLPSQIIRRVIVIDRERTVREAIIRSWDSVGEARRKVQAVLNPPPSVSSVKSVVKTS